MRISRLIEELAKTMSKHGDIEVTCTASVLKDDTTCDGDNAYLPDVWESTVENLIITNNEKFGKRVRLYL